MKRVVIVGGGITGLAAAYALERASCPLSVHLVEASPRLGGNIQTVTHNGFTIDAGPDAWVSNKPHAAQLARAVGLGDEIIGTRPESRKVYIVWQRRLHPMPAGLVLGIPTEISPFIKTDLLTLDAKLRAGLEPLIPRKDLSGGADETIASFVSRRLGDQICTRIVGPLLGGIFTGDPEELSVRTCVPQLIEAEQKYGSLIFAMRALRAKRKAQAASGESEASAFQSLKRGMGDLVVNVAHKLRNTKVRTDHAVRRVARLEPNDDRGRWVVETEADTLFADDVALTVPAHAAAQMLHGVDDDLERILGATGYVSTATAFLAYRTEDVPFPLDSVGFLVPHAEGRPIVAGTFVSSKWDHRAPPGQVLLRVFFGGARAEHILERTDEALVQIAREQLADLLGVTSAPAFARVFRFLRATPQPTVGHLERMTKLRTRLDALPGLYIGGNGYIGSGMPDAIKQGEEIASRISPLPL